MSSDNAIIDEDTARFFVWAVWNFFTTSTNIEAQVGAPFLCEAYDHHDYTGIIGVSGNRKGTLFFTIGRDCMTELIERGCQHIKRDTLDEETYEELVKDYTGEIANTVSGNVRNYLGEHFLISVPVVMAQPGEKIEPIGDQQGIVFPITWMEHNCSLILCFERRFVDQEGSSESLESLILSES